MPHRCSSNDTCPHSDSRTGNSFTPQPKPSHHMYIVTVDHLIRCCETPPPSFQPTHTRTHADGQLLYTWSRSKLASAAAAPACLRGRRVAEVYRDEMPSAPAPRQSACCSQGSRDESVEERRSSDGRSPSSEWKELRAAAVASPRVAELVRSAEGLENEGSRITDAQLRRSCMQRIHDSLTCCHWHKAPSGYQYNDKRLVYTCLQPLLF